MSTYWGDLEPPQPGGFQESDGRTDWGAFRRHLMQEFRTRYSGASSATTTLELARQYFSSEDARTVSKMGQELQNLRAALEFEEEELVNLGNRWYLATQPEDHLNYAQKGIRRARSAIRIAGRRLGIGARQFPDEIGGHPAMRALPGADAAVGELEGQLTPEEPEDQGPEEGDDA